MKPLPIVQARSRRMTDKWIQVSWLERYTQGSQIPARTENRLIRNTLAQIFNIIMRRLQLLTATGTNKTRGRYTVLWRDWLNLDNKPSYLRNCWLVGNIKRLLRYSLRVLIQQCSNCICVSRPMYINNPSQKILTRL